MIVVVGMREVGDGEVMVDKPADIAVLAEEGLADRMPADTAAAKVAAVGAIGFVGAPEEPQACPRGEQE